MANRNTGKNSVKRPRLIIEELLEDGSDPDVLYD